MSSRLKTLKSTDDDPNHQSPAATIPYLPDNVIEKILSFLPINLAAQANTVSKQWAKLWPSFIVIDLDEGCYSERERFLDMLYFSLRRSKDQRVLDKLRIRASLELGFQEVSEWLDFAMERCVKELDIQDLGQNRINNATKNFLIPHDVLTLESLTTLNLENVRLYASSGIDGTVNLPSLKNMSLKHVAFLEDVEDTAIKALPSLVSGCPCLEHLSIDVCKLGYSAFRLEISSDSLKSLEITHCPSRTVDITAKNLESFTFYSKLQFSY